MNHVEFRSVRRRARRLARWIVLVVPLCLTGCFDTESSTRPGKARPGIFSLSRFFPSAPAVSRDNPAEAVAAVEPQVFIPSGITGIANFGDAAEFDIALPAFVGYGQRGESATRDPGLTAANSDIASAGDSGASLLLLNRSFNQLFSSLFPQARTDDVVQAGPDDLPNPFTEARQKQEQSPETKSSTDAQTPSESERKNAANEPASEKTDPAGTASGPGISAADEFLIVGDADGSGTLSVLQARRSSGGLFASDKGEMAFDLYVNAYAVEQQRSFYIDDVDQDGSPDLLVTGVTSLFGAVLLGDGNGGFRYSDKFLTGYEPVAAVAGPVHEGKREILTVNMRTGIVKTYHTSESSKPIQIQELAFVPDYLLPLTAATDSADYVLASTIAGTEQVLGWGDDRLVHPSTAQLEADPMILSTSFGPDTLQIYQVGSYASVLLTSQGKSFNVAGMRRQPRTFLVIGDFRNRGSLDVAVGIKRQ